MVCMDKLRNNSGSVFLFPEMTLPPGHTVKVHSGRGWHQKNPDKQLEIYLGSFSPIWDNQYDVATLSDGSGTVQDERVHAPKGEATD